MSIILTTIACVSSMKTTATVGTCDSRFSPLPDTGLNNCVGKANYPYFFRCMVSIAAMLLVHGVVQIALILDIYVGNGGSRERAEDWFGVDATVAIVVVIAVFLFLDFASFSLISQLLVFHLKLRREGLTTYAFIVRDNQRRREKTKREEELECTRPAEISKAKEEGRIFRRWGLECGGAVRQTCGVQFCCDPLQAKKEPEETGDDSQNGAANGDDR